MRRLVLLATVEYTGPVEAAAIRALVEGPTAEEADAGLVTAVPPNVVRIPLRLQ